jgi:3-dehydroquinate synthase
MSDYSTITSFDNTLSKIIIGDGNRDVLRLIPTGQRVICITDHNVKLLHPQLTNNYETIVITPGERSKSLATIEEIIVQLLDKGADRQTFLLGVGGGVVCDITGFTASIFMRGVKFGFVATTLLAQVDAAIGGKNGVDVKGFKNMAGVFRQPEFVICDSSILRTLPDREFKSGMAEIIKSAIIADKKLMNICRQWEYGSTDNNLLEDIISRAIAVKTKIVQADEKESGLRKVLNLGHSFGHAIEKCSSEVLHGEAVSIGMCYAADIATDIGICSPETRDEICRTISILGLPTDSNISKQAIFEAMLTDKKHSNQTIDLILPQTIGHCTIEKVSFGKIKQLMKID